ncbi:hypothetical protein [Romboutsia ilealis]|uniref:hypothetical protein n=1 Tax=Romboutsia ilealis TaxID=1115758 RepID=UPI00272AFFD6|nr:hypothetical protein [Romboutsia ilealis]
MAKSKEEIKKELNDVKIQFKEVKEGIKNINEEQRIKIEKQKEEQLRKIEEKRIETGKVNYFHVSAWDTMSEKTLKRFNLFFRTVGISAIIVGLLVFFAAGDKLGLILSIPGLFFALLDVRKFTSSYKNNK